MKKIPKELQELIPEVERWMRASFTGGVYSPRIEELFCKFKNANCIDVWEEIRKRVREECKPFGS